MDEWIKGYPSERGLYHCIVDGKEQILVHHICMNNGKHWWSDVRGYDVVGYEIKYKGKKLNVTDIK